MHTQMGMIRNEPKNAPVRSVHSSLYLQPAASSFSHLVFGRLKDQIK